ncbi:SAM-dependent methyltransferase [Desulfuromonas versatilis]|uniref:SAM-dependent methyltransferase n=1 Tax=Desulfuromonas versatilis TaxID=2802975 RepID=A0ABM8HQ81_9BACT|nr:tRNA1(Val) (adenine(37)-N6)-methyltransferase [Desulfuromonas versatilis]BCR03935.1 SAM-dependent methyltransferase [Desulfuromonas versatilis]
MSGPEIILRSDETLDDLRLGGLKIIQKKDGYRFSLDPVLLCAFARVAPGEALADLGTGSGVIPLLLARMSEAERLVGVEVQPGMAGRARRSVELNGLAGRVEIVEADLRSLQGTLPAQGFDVVLANPPFRPLGTGRQAPTSERGAARHEQAGGLGDFLRAAAFLLGDGGRFYVVYLAERLVDLLAGMREAGLEPKRLRCVHSRRGEGARMVLLEGRRRGRPGLVVEPPLYVCEGEDYSAEVLTIYGEQKP